MLDVDTRGSVPNYLSENAVMMPLNLCKFLQVKYGSYNSDNHRLRRNLISKTSVLIRDQEKVEYGEVVHGFNETKELASKSLLLRDSKETEPCSTEQSDDEYGSSSRLETKSNITHINPLSNKKLSKTELASIVENLSKTISFLLEITDVHSKNL